MIQIAALRSRLEKQPTDLRRNSRDLGDGTLAFAPFGTDNDFDRPSGTGPLCIATQALRAWLGKTGRLTSSAQGKPRRFAYSEPIKTSQF